jgi:plastocyanin
MRSPVLLLAGTVLLALGAAAPGVSSPAPVESRTTTAAAPVKVVMRDNKFRPHRVVVPLGRTVRWKNLDEAAHTVVTQNQMIRSKAILGGQTFRYRPRKRGRIRYFCTIHAGQDGLLIVR